MTFRNFIYTFIPIFVAMDVGGLAPVYLSLTKGLSPQDRKRVNWQALSTALVISLIFIGVGRFIFDVLGITSADFEIAGGLLLLVLAIAEILQLGAHDPVPDAHVGPVPLGTPLIVGPAVLTSLIILIDQRGYAVTLLALLVNLAIVAVAFRQSQRLVQAIGEDGLRAASRVVGLFLAAIAVSMIRRGIQAVH